MTEAYSTADKQLPLGATLSSTRLVDSGWSQEIAAAVQESGDLRVICPFIKYDALNRLLASNPKPVRVITRFNLRDFAAGVSDIAALRRLLDCGAAVRGIIGLHAKMYLFGSKRTIVTSANLTKAALDQNQEFGVVSDQPEIVAACRRYFDDLWRRGGSDLTMTQLDEWDETVTRCQAKGTRTIWTAGLGDFGADAGSEIPAPSVLPTIVADAPQFYVKFLGSNNNRVSLSFRTIEEIKRAGCHWALPYPAQKRPRSVKNGAAMFIGRLMHEPNDIRVFGRAIGMGYVEGRDDASPEDVDLRKWKADWPHYIRVHHAEFVAGTMANGVSLNELMMALDANSFTSTQRNAAIGEGNTDPRLAYRRHPAVELSAEGAAWLEEHLQAAFDLHGKIPQDDLAKLDWPQVD